MNPESIRKLLAQHKLDAASQFELSASLEELDDSDKQKRRKQLYDWVREEDLSFNVFNALLDHFDLF